MFYIFLCFYEKIKCDVYNFHKKFKLRHYLICLQFSAMDCIHEFTFCVTKEN